MLVVLAACGSQAATGEVVVRGVDDVQVLTPTQVSEQRRPVESTTTVPATADPAAPTTVAGDTVPQNVDDRPPEIKLFDAFGKFRGCLEDRGYGIDGDLLDQNNPAYQDPDYVDAVSTCAARTDIVAILQEVQVTRSSLTPEEVEQRNEVFTSLRDCLEGKGWTVETTTSAIGLLEPAVFQNAEGVLDERDINQCLSEQSLED
ncbi:MAG: hypothetical protein ACOYL9_13895 [Ilumatobacteraceae bacterium]|jgi:hypothetical protein